MSYVQEIESSEEEEVDLVAEAASTSPSASRSCITPVEDGDDNDNDDNNVEDQEDDPFLRRRGNAVQRFERMGVSDSVRNALSMVKSRSSNASSSAVTASGAAGVETERSGFMSKNKEMIRTNDMQAMKASSQRSENQTVRSEDLIHSASSQSKGVASSFVTNDSAAERSSFQTKKQETLASNDGMMASKEASHRIDKAMMKNAQVNNSTFKSHRTFVILSSYAYRVCDQRQP